MKTRLLVFIIVILVLVDLALVYPTLTGKITQKIEYRYVNITRIIDGDTLEADGEKIRLLGINTPEKNQLYYEDAKFFIQTLEGKELKLEDYGKDKYQRTLGYLYYTNQLVNKLILEQGLASLYYYEQDSHYKELEKAEKYARNKQIGIWKKSDNYGCIEIIEFDYISEGGEGLVLNNKCQTIKAILKDDATHIYNIELNPGIFRKSFNKIWNDDGDSVYIWDEKGLVLFYRY